MARPFAHVAITGASSGIGAALADVHAAPKIRLALAGRNVQRLEGVAERCRARGAEVTTAIVDVTDAEAMAAWIAAADEVQPLDLGYANAGLGGVRAIADPEGEPISIAHEMIGTNLIGVVNTVNPLLTRFCERRRGHVVLVGSLAANVGLPHSPIYCATKAAVATYAHALRRLVATSGVQVTLVEPGFVDTPMSEGVPQRGLMLWSAPQAAARIVRGVEARQAVVRFPLPLALFIGLVRHLPRRVADALLTASYQRGRT